MAKLRYVDLEKDERFKKKYFNQTSWWKNILLIAPVSFLFVGIFGILSLYHYDRLISVYLIPYAAFFLVGSIWMRAVKAHIQRVSMAASDSYRICLSKPIGEQEGYVYTLFVNTDQRHNEHYIQNLVNQVSSDPDLMASKACRKEATPLRVEDAQGVFIRAYFKKDIAKRNLYWAEDGSFPVLFINPQNTFVVSRKDLDAK